MWYVQLNVSSDVILPEGGYVGFSDEVRAAQERDVRCGLGTALRSMDKKFCSEVLEALADSTLEHTAIADKLVELGYRVNRLQVSICRRKCRCGAIPQEG